MAGSVSVAVTWPASTLGTAVGVGAVESAESMVRVLVMVMALVPESCAKAVMVHWPNTVLAPVGLIV